jgi:hypothetical protein
VEGGKPIYFPSHSASNAAVIVKGSRHNNARCNKSLLLIFQFPSQITLGFAISIEGTVISMTPLSFPWNVIVYVIVAFLTGWAWIESGWLHNKLLGIKGRYETKAR